LKEIFVHKRNGDKEPYNHEKIQRQIAFACEGINNVSQSMIEINMNLEIYDGITTLHIDRLAENSAVKLITDPDGHVNYQYVAGRLKNSALRKEVYGQYDPPSLYEIVRCNVEAGLYTPELLTWYTSIEWAMMDGMIDHSRDEKYSHAGISQLADKYLIRNRSTGQLYETPQVRYIIAAATVMHAEPDRRMQFVKEYYNHVSTGDFTCATPVLAGLGSKTRQFSSCVLIQANDSLDSIFASGEMMGKYASKRAGIGFEIGKIRRAGAAIRGGEIEHTGLVPFIKKWFADLRATSQGGIRNASATLFFPIWHHDFEELIVLKNNAGTEETRVRHLDYGVMTCKYLWNRMAAQKPMTLFDPNEVPDLYEAYYSDQKKFIKLYEKYEKDPSKHKVTIGADEVHKKLRVERSDTSRIYVACVDNIIAQGPIDSELFPIYMSNLCMEILIPTVSFERLDDDRGRLAMCTLASNNWGQFKRPEQMRKSCHMAVRSLNNILEYQEFLSVQAQLANEDFRPLGIGVTNLAYWHAKRGLRYGSPQALAEVKRWMEHQAFYCLEASVQLAKERGACKQSRHTDYQKGIFPWEKRAVDVNELTDFTPELDWEPLRAEAKRYGVRNALLGAIAPVESSSVAMLYGSTNGMELPKALISTKESKGSSLTQVVPEYERLKKSYQLMFGPTAPTCEEYLKTSAVLCVYIDQSASTNTYQDPAMYEGGKIPATVVVKDMMNFFRWGGKTLYYSITNKTGMKEQLNETASDNSLRVDADDAYCESCVL
jgi:ribonucleoside-diphosphate reductase alpha chain